MKLVFSIVLSIHGLIHLMGFAKPFKIVEISQLSQSISKPMGLIWLMSCVLFLITVLQLITNKTWFYTALVAVFISQVLIILHWQDAKYGSVLNAIILLVSFSVLMTNRFNKMVMQENRQILKSITVNNPTIIADKDIEHLPQIVQKWIKKSGVINNQKVSSVWLQQVGTMRIKPKGNWMSFKATQNFNVEKPAFVWQTKIEIIPLIQILGRDKFVNGNGEMLIKLAGFIPVVKESNNSKINQGAMVRYLAEICWFPSAALNEYITWNYIDESSVKATFTYKDQSVSGVFSFSTTGDFVSFTANRFYGGNVKSTEETWFVEALSYKKFNGVRLPNKSKVTWKLQEGDFNWLNVEITDIKYNLPITH